MALCLPKAGQTALTVASKQQQQQQPVKLCHIVQHKATVYQL